MDDYKIHFKWAIAFGVLFLISIITFWLGGKENEIVSYLSFASSLISIILAIIAIFYSMIQNANSQQNIGEMKSLLYQASSLLTEKAGTLEQHSKTMLNAALSFQSQANSQPMPTVTFPLDVSTCSPVGLLALYSLAKTNETGKQMSLFHLADELSEKNASETLMFFHYGLGTLIGFACFMSEHRITLDFMHQKAETLPPALMDYILKNIQNRIDNPQEKNKELLIKGLSGINSYFDKL